ncbi:MAG: exodeoxyribonuclease VII small subunit [Verrucomicrobiota bacterium]|jgi:exodeoxyribonuclease VII small subunit|nr:exodeoxyribonuclease VII small subunit [Verrucomicrobiota bacterium]
MPAKAKKTTKKSEEISFEEAAEKLESIVEAMESDELPLEKLLVQYEQGAKLAKICEDKLEAAEKRITQLDKNMGGELSSRTVTFGEDED